MAPLATACGVCGLHPDQAAETLETRPGRLLPAVCTVAVPPESGGGFRGMTQAEHPPYDPYDICVGALRAGWKSGERTPAEAVEMMWDAMAVSPYPMPKLTYKGREQAVIMAAQVFSDLDPDPVDFGALASNVLRAIDGLEFTLEDVVQDFLALGFDLENCKTYGTQREAREEAYRITGYSQAQAHLRAGLKLIDHPLKDAPAHPQALKPLSYGGIRNLWTPPELPVKRRRH